MSKDKGDKFASNHQTLVMILVSKPNYEPSMVLIRQSNLQTPVMIYCSLLTLKIVYFAHSRYNKITYLDMVVGHAIVQPSDLSSFPRIDR